jgi:HlyD family secretion protein
MRRWLTSILVLAALGGGGYALWRYLREPEAAKPVFQTHAVDRGRIIGKVTATGTVSALVTVQVGSQVSGRIKKIYVDFNSPVRKGQLIALIDPQLFQAAVEQARANLVAAQGNLALAKAKAVDARRQYERARLLSARDLIAKADLDTAEANALASAAQVEAAQGAVEQARAALKQAQTNLDYTRIVSPTSGVVISRNVDVGQTVAASFQAPVLFLIAEDLKKMQVDTNVAEADVGRLRAGMKATFTVDAYPNERFTGVVRQIRNAPQTIQNVVTYDAVIDVENPELKLKPGMTANVTFTYADRKNVLRVPNSALRFRPPRGGPKRDGGPSGRSGPDRGPSGRSGPDAGPMGLAWGGPNPDGGPMGLIRGRPGAGSAPDRSPPAEGRRTVWILENPNGSDPRPVWIRTGITDGSMTEVLEGELGEGQLVVVGLAQEGRPEVGRGIGGRGIF